MHIPTFLYVYALSAPFRTNIPKGPDACIDTIEDYVPSNNNDGICGFLSPSRPRQSLVSLTDDGIWLTDMPGDYCDCQDLETLADAPYCLTSACMDRQEWFCHVAKPPNDDSNLIWPDQAIDINSCDGQCYICDGPGCHNQKLPTINSKRKQLPPATEQLLKIEDAIHAEEI